MKIKDNLIKALEKLTEEYGEKVFLDHVLASKAIDKISLEDDTTRIQNLLYLAIIQLDAYTRIKKAISENNLNIISLLADEMSTDFEIITESAQDTIECLADFIGFSLKTPSIRKKVEEHFKNSLKLRESSSPSIYLLYLPFYKVDSINKKPRTYNIYLINDKGNYFLSDRGITYHEFDSIFVINEPDVQRVLKEVLKQYGCSIENKSFVINCTLADVHIKASYLVQVISFLLNMKIFYS